MRKQPPFIRERIAIFLHEQHKEHKDTNHLSFPWVDLPENIKNVYLGMADHMIYSLEAIGFEIRERQHPPHIRELTDDEIEQLAKCMHERWTQDQIDEGWRYGPTKNWLKKITPHLLSWDSLPDDAREAGRIITRRILIILANIGFEIIPFGQSR